MEMLETEIATVGRKLDEIEEEIKQLKKNPVEEGTKGYAAWREDLTWASDEKKQLRDEKKQLRDKEILLLNKQASQEPAQKRQKVACDELPPDRLEVSLGGFIDTTKLMPLHAAVEGDEPKLMYLRQPVVDILELLDAKGTRGFWLKGAPGTGKSQVGRLWATQQALSQQNQTVFYGEVRDVGYWVTEFADGKWEQFQYEQFDDFKTVLRKASDAQNTVVVFDGAVGLKNSPHAELAGYLLQRGGVVLSSGQLECRDHPCDAEMTGWLLRECLAATDNEDFFKTTILATEGDIKEEKQRRAFITNKYDTTGGSARLMFEYETSKASDMLESALEKLSAEEKKDVLFGKLDPTHDKSRNILTQGFSTTKGNYKRTNLKHAFTSKLVLTTLRSSINLDDVKTLYLHCKSLHRVIEGWAFEELQLRLFERDKENAGEVKLRVRDETKPNTEGKEESWETVSLITFNTKPFKDEGLLLDLTGKPIQLLNFDKVILRPDVTFNESWDAVLVRKEALSGQAIVFYLTFLEVTLQKSHTLSEMVLVQDFKRFLNIVVNASVSPQVRHIGFVESDAFPDFLFNRTSALPTRENRSGTRTVPEGFVIECLVATITSSGV